ncbi:MAG: HDOD domain-containing protein [Pseudomonadota bacterium]
MYHWLQRLFSGPAAADGLPQDDPEPVPMPAAAPEPAPTPAPTAAAALPQRPPVSFDQLDTIDGNYYRWLFENEGESELDANAAETEVLDALAAILKSQQSGSALVRRMPGLIPQLLQSLRSDSFSGAQLSRTISSDVVLVAAVLRLANCSFKGTGNSITSIEHAVMLIGQEGLRQLITSVAFRPIIDVNSGMYTRTMAPRIWDRSERCAVANRLQADALGIDPFEAFLAGVVQNVGLIVTLRIMDQAAKGERVLGSEMFCVRLVRDARLLSCSIGREWNFPENVTRAIEEQATLFQGKPISPLGRLLAQTDYLSKVRMLVEHGRAKLDDPQLFFGLPDNARACYASLEAIDDAAP